MICGNGYLHKLTFVAVLSLSLTACSAIPKLEDVAGPTVAAGVATGVAALNVHPAAAIASGAAAGIATETAIPDPQVDPGSFTGEDGELSFTELLAYMWFNFTQHLIGLGIVAGAVWFLTGYLGARKRRPEEKALEKQVLTLVDKIGKMRE